MTSTNPGMFFSSETLKGLMSTQRRKKTARKPVTTEAYQSEVDQLVKSILKQETGRDNIPKNQFRKKTIVKGPAAAKRPMKTKTITVRKMRAQEPQKFHNFAWNNIFNYASAVGLDRIHVEFLEHNFGQYQRSTLVASHSLEQGYALVAENRDGGVMTVEEAAAALAIADVDVDEFAFTTALRKAHLEPMDETKPTTERSPEQEKIAFNMFSHSLVHDIGVHQMASVLAERHGLLATQKNKGGTMRDRSSTSSFLPGSVFDSSSMMQSSYGGPSLHHSQSVQKLHDVHGGGSEFAHDNSDANVRRSISQGKAPGEGSFMRQDMMLTLPPLPSNGGRFDSTNAMAAMAKKRRRKGSTQESTFSNKKLQSIAGFDQSFGRETPRCLRDGSTRAISVEKAGSMSAIEELRRELRMAEEGLSRLDNIVEDNIAWVQSNCESSMNFEMSTRAKTKCRKISVEKLADVLGNSAYFRLDKAFKRWRMMFQFTDMMAIVRSYSKIKSIQLLGNAIGKIIYRLQTMVFAKWTRMVNLMRRFEQEAAIVDIQRIVRGRLGKLKSKRRIVELEQIRIYKTCQTIQKIVRGRQGRKRFLRKWQENKREWAIYRLHLWFRTTIEICRAKDFVRARRNRRNAAIKIQKIARGIQGRRRFARFKAAAEKRKMEEASSSRLAKFLRRNKDTKSERNLLKQKKEEKKKRNIIQAGLDSLSSKLSNFSRKDQPALDNDNDIDKYNFGSHIDAAAIKLQALSRGRLVRQKSGKAKTAKGAVSGEAQSEPQMSDKEKAELDAAALKLQAVSRGRLARKNSEKLIGEKKKTGMSFFSRKRDNGEEENSVSSEKSTGLSERLFSGKLFGRGNDSPTRSIAPPTPEPVPVAAVVEPVQAEAVVKPVAAVQRPKSRESSNTVANIEVEKKQKPEAKVPVQMPIPLQKEEDKAKETIGKSHVVSENKLAADTKVGVAKIVAPEKPKDQKAEAVAKSGRVVSASKTRESSKSVKDTKPVITSEKATDKPILTSEKATDKPTPTSEKATDKPTPAKPSAAAKAARARKAVGGGSTKTAEAVSPTPSAETNKEDKLKSPSAKQPIKPAGRSDNRSPSPAADKAGSATKPPSGRRASKDIAADSKDNKSPSTKTTRTQLKSATKRPASGSMPSTRLNSAADNKTASKASPRPDAVVSAAPTPRAENTEPEAIQPVDADAGIGDVAELPVLATVNETNCDDTAQVLEPMSESAVEQHRVLTPEHSVESSPARQSTPEKKTSPVKPEEPSPINHSSGDEGMKKPIRRNSKHRTHPPVEEESQSMPSPAVVAPDVLTASPPQKSRAPTPEPITPQSPQPEALIEKPRPLTPEPTPVTSPAHPDALTPSSRPDIMIDTEGDKRRRSSRSTSPGNMMRSAKNVLNNMGSSFRRAISPLVGIRPISSKGGSQSSLGYSEDSPARSLSRDSMSHDSVQKQGSRSSLLSQDERDAVNETKKMIDAQRKAAEYLTWAVVTIQRLARQYLAKNEAKTLRALKKKRPRQWVKPGPDSKYFAAPKDLSRPRPKRKKHERKAEKKKVEELLDEDNVEEEVKVISPQEEAANKIAAELKAKMEADAVAMEERIKRLEALENSLVEREMKIFELSQQAELQAQQAKEALTVFQQHQKDTDVEKKKMQQLLEMAAGPLSHRSDMMATGGMMTGGSRRSTARRQMSARDRGLPPTALSARGGAGVPEDANSVSYEGDDWVQLWDPDEYSWYWYNRRTQDAQWEYPGTDADGYSGYESAGGMTDYSTDAGEESGYESEYAHPPQHKSTNGVSPWQEFWDEQAQAKYWFNESTGEASWTRPEGIAGGSRPSSAAMGRNSARPAGDDWVSYIDADTDQEYWYNATTGETSWSQV